MKYVHVIIYKRMNQNFKFSEPYIIFICYVDEVSNKQLYVNYNSDYNLLHEGAHIEMLLLNYGFK